MPEYLNRSNLIIQNPYQTSKPTLSLIIRSLKAVDKYRRMKLLASLLRRGNCWGARQNHGNGCGRETNRVGPSAWLQDRLLP
jgi:hypothetical protein